VVPNVDAAMFEASDDAVVEPPTICDGRSSTRMSSSALMQACAATKWIRGRCQRTGTTTAMIRNTPPITPTAHGPNASSSIAITVNALIRSRPPRTAIEILARRPVGVMRSSSAPQSGVPMYPAAAMNGNPQPPIMVFA